MIQPPSVGDEEIHTHHAGGVGPAGSRVVDNFGDAEPALGIADDPSLDRTTNTRGLPVTATEPALVRWEDVDHLQLGVVMSPYDTRGTRLAWTGAGASHTTSLGGVAARPTDALSIRAAQALVEGAPPDALSPIGRALDAFATLRDATGAKATVRLGASAALPAPSPRAGICPMRTVRIPLDAFSAANPMLSLDRLDSLTIDLTARTPGDLLIDDVEIGP